MATSSDISESNSSRILELALPLKTNAMAVYALATKPSQGSLTDYAYKNTYGAIETSGTGFNHDLTDVEFSLVNRLTDEAAFTRFGNLLARIMTGLISTECKESGASDRRYAYWWPQDETSCTWATREGDVQSGNTLPADDTERLAHEAAGYTYVVGNASWMDMCDVYEINHDGDLSNNVYQSPLDEVLGEVLHQIITIQVDPNDATKVELRAGSAASILKTVRDLNDVIGRVINAETTTQSEQVAQELAKEIRYRMSQFFTTTDEWTSVNWKTIAQIVTAAQTYIPDYNTAIAGSAFNADYLPSNTTLSGGFPLNLGLPMSTALLTVVEDANGKHFEYLDAVPAYGMGAGSVPIVNYRFPPEIIYWANSGIRVNDDVKAKTDYPSTVATWANPSEAKWSGWTNNGSVLSTTRSVAMMKQVNYGVALMQTNVSYYNLDGVVAYDNNSGIHEGEADNAIVLDATSFKVTGIFIGGVTDRVGWDLTRIIAADNAPDKIIYDHVSEGGYGIPMPGSATMYTTTWDNYIPWLDAGGNVLGLGRQEDQTDVYVALELVNNTGKDIWGELNLIRDGGTFYLVGKLDLAAAIAASATTFPEEKYCHYPPYNPETGETISVKRVFMQDYMTVANLKFTRNSLKHAYVTVPDLRSSQISLGLSVDLKWNEGLSFNVEL